MHNLTVQVANREIGVSFEMSENQRRGRAARRMSNESEFLNKQIAQSILHSDGDNSGIHASTTAAAAAMPGQSLPDFGVPGVMRTSNGMSRSLTAGVSGEKSGEFARSGTSLGGSQRRSSKIYDDPSTVAGYASVPLIEIDKLPRGGISLETKSVGRIQFGIPPETIKDSMLLGLGVPQIYIVPVERFCREMGPALGINLAEFEFPAYFNYFVRNKRCTLVVDSNEAEQQIRRVFGETLLGPAQFRNHGNPTFNEDEDFDPNYSRDARPNFYREFYHFRTAEESTNFQELTIDTLIEFSHFKGSQQGRDTMRSFHTASRIGVPPNPPPTSAKKTQDDLNKGDSIPVVPRRHGSISREGNSETTSALCKLSIIAEAEDTSTRTLGESSSSANGVLRRSRSDPDMSESSHRRAPLTEGSFSSQLSRKNTPTPTQAQHVGRRGSGDTQNSMTHSRGTSFTWDTVGTMASEDEGINSGSWMYSQAKWLGEVATIFSAAPDGKRKTSGARVEIFKMTGGTEYIVHDVDDNNIIIGKAKFSGTVRMPDEISVEGFLAPERAPKLGLMDMGEDDELHVSIPRHVVPPDFHPPSFGVTCLGNSHGFDKNGSTSGYVLWINGRGIMIDPPPYSSSTLEREGIRPQMIVAIIITHCHADHDAGTFQKVMTGSRVAIITTPTIYNSFIRKYSALSGLSPTLLRHSHRHRPAIIGQTLRFQGASFNFIYTLHTIPCIGFKVEWRGRSIVFTGDHLNSPMIEELEGKGVMHKERADDLRRLPLQECDALLHEAGAPPIHTPLSVLKALPQNVKDRLYVVHTSALPEDCDLRVAPTGTAGTLRLDQDIRIPGPAPSKRRPEDEEKKLALMKDMGSGSDIVTSDDGLSSDNDADPSHHSKKGGKKRKGKKKSSSDKASNREKRPWKSLFGKKHKNESGKDREIDSSDDGAKSQEPARRHDQPLNKSITSSANEHGTHEGVDISSLDDGGHPSLSVLGNYTVPSPSALEKLTSGDKAGEGKLPPLVFVRPTCVSDAWFILNLLSAVPFFSSLSYSNTMEVLEIAQVELFCAGDVVLSAQRRPEVLCVVWEGTCVERAASIERGVGDKQSSDLLLGSPPGAMDNPTVWHAGDWTGPLALQPDVERSAEMVSGEELKDIVALSNEGVKVIMLNMKDLHIILQRGSQLFRKYLTLREKQLQEEAVMKAKRESNPYEYAEQPHSFRVPQSGQSWFAFDSVIEVLKCNSALCDLTALQKRHFESLGDGPRFFSAGTPLWKARDPVDFAFLVVAGTVVFQQKQKDDEPKGGRSINRRFSTGTISLKTPELLANAAAPTVTEDKALLDVPANSEFARLEVALHMRVEEMEMDSYDHARDADPKERQSRLARDRFANKVLARLYARRAFTPGIVFSRGHFLSDTSRMVSGDLALSQGREGNQTDAHHCHTSTIVAGPEGCVVMVFARSSLVQFLDSNPGVLLSLLGTIAVV